MPHQVTEKRLCQAFVERGQARCSKPVRWGRKYCWWHYPKAGPITALVLGAFLGLVMTLLFNDPIARVLSKRWPFHYLDRNPPVISGIVPDIVRSAYVDANTVVFGVAFRDDLAGLDLAKCDLGISYVDQNGGQPVEGKLDKQPGRLQYVAKERLRSGEYILKTSLYDRAKNGLESEYPFVIPENDILSIRATYEEYDASKHEIKMPVPWDGQKNVPNNLYVYSLTLYNRAKATYCRNIYVRIDVEDGVIWQFEEVGGEGYNLIASLSTPESLRRNGPKDHDRVFGPQQVVHIQEIAPKGFLNFRVLVGFVAFGGRKPGTPREIQVSGIYISDGYRRTTLVDVWREISIVRNRD
jgi:hypothetical protein